MTTDPTENICASIRYTRERYGASEAALAFKRRRGPDVVIQPTEADWEVYRSALAAVAKAEENAHIYIGLVEIDEPEPRREPGDYIEREDEWLARVISLIVDSGNIPQDLGSVLSMREYRAIAAVLGEYASSLR